MGKSERLEKENWEEQTPKKGGQVIRGRANQKSPGYYGEFINLVDESTEKPMKKESGQTSEKNSESGKSTEKRVPKTTRKGKKKAKKGVPGGKPSEEGFFNDPKLISNKAKNQKSKDGKNNREKGYEELAGKDEKINRAGLENIQTISIEKRAKKGKSIEKATTRKEQDSYEITAENAEEFTLIGEGNKSLKKVGRDSVDKKKPSRIKQKAKDIDRETVDKERWDNERQLREKPGKEMLREKEKVEVAPANKKQEHDKEEQEQRKQKQIKQNRIKQDLRKQDLAKQEQIKLEEVKQDHTRQDQRKQEQKKPDRTKQDKLQSNKNIAKKKESDKPKNKIDETRRKKVPKEASASVWEEVDNSKSVKPIEKANNVAGSEQIQGILQSKTGVDDNQQSVKEKAKATKQKFNESVESVEATKPKNQNKPKKTMSKRNKRILGIGFPVALLLSAYIVVSLFYTNRFVDRTTINGYDFSRAYPLEVSEFFANKGETFTLEMTGLGGLEETITGEELELSISDNGQVMELLDNQSSWTWPVILLTGRDYQIDLLVEYSEDLLVERVDQIVCLERDITFEPEDAAPYFNGERFEIREEVMGTLINPDIVISHIQASMTAYGNSLDLVEIDAYILPIVFSDQPELVAGVEQLNHYVGASITYDLNPKQVVVNHEQIVDWLSWDDNFRVTFHEEMARDFMSEFMVKYSTLGTIRTFTNPLGMEAEVESHVYGWDLDEETEVEAFLSNIRNGETAHREPAHFTRGSFHETGEWGDTYIQVCLTDQHLWYFVDGELVLESPVVTGMAGRSQTPPGIFEILWMASPTILRGPIIDHETGEREWESPVSYWMAITWTGIGLHDATWQPYFGGNRWTYGGSQGCINMPHGLAGELYGMVEEGTMTIVHW